MVDKGSGSSIFTDPDPGDPKRLDLDPQHWFLHGHFPKCHHSIYGYKYMLRTKCKSYLPVDDKSCIKGTFFPLPESYSGNIRPCYRTIIIFLTKTIVEVK